MKIDVRRLAPEDVPAYRTLMLKAYAEHPDAFTSTPEERACLPDAWWAARAGVAQPEAAECVVAGFIEGQLAGAAGLKREGRERTRHKGDLFGMIVEPRWRGRGVGRAVVEGVLAEARRRPGLELLQLTVSETNTQAEALYRACGFERFGVEPMALKFGPGRYVAKVHMWCRL